MVAKNIKKTKFVCSNFGNISSKWVGKCLQCNEWNSMHEESEINITNPKTFFSSKSDLKKPLKISEINSKSNERINLEFPEIDRVLGGGIVPGSVILCGGEPGIGKSTLILQICKFVAQKNKKVLYCSGEESEFQIKMRAERIGLFEDSCYIMSDGNLENIINATQKINPSLLIIDSIQTVFIANSNTSIGSITQIRDVTSILINLAKRDNIALIIIGHVTKEGNLAGPRMLEHMVDAVAYLEGDRSYQFRMLRMVKNRFGSTDETGLFSMNKTGLSAINNPSEFLLRERASNIPGSIATTLLEGMRAVIIEVQALTVATVLNMPRRVTVGYDYNRITMLLAVLEKRANQLFSRNDVYINIPGGIYVRETAVDLAVALAVVSINNDVPISAEMIVLGEVSLTGEILPVSGIIIRIKEAIKMKFKKFILPMGNKKDVEKYFKENDLLYLLKYTHFITHINDAINLIKK